MEKCYSLNNEEFSFTELDDAVSDKFNNDLDIKAGDIFTVYEGDAVLWKAGDFTEGFPTDTLGNNAYDNAGEYADEWPNCTKEQEADLAQRLKDAVNQWADEHGLQPKFYHVKNVKKLQIKMISENGDYETLEI